MKELEAGGGSPWPGPCEIVDEDGNVLAFTSGPIDPLVEEEDEYGDLDFESLVDDGGIDDGGWLE